MELLRGRSGAKEVVLTFGNFDGVHLGHLHIFSEVVGLSKKHDLAAAVLTFSPHTAVFLKERKHFLLLDFDNKVQLMEECGIDYLYVMEFCDSFAKMAPEAFIADILVKQCKAKYIVVGKDCIFGHKCKGNLDMLRSYSSIYGYEVIAVDQISTNGYICSSSQVRTHIEKGDIRTANLMLGRNHIISGIVMRGSARGRTIGFPTLNLSLETVVLPKRGVYSARAKIGSGHLLPGVVNIGVRPTFTNEQHPILEMHIFDFDQDIYGKRVTVELMDFIRPEQRFKNVEQLVSQIKKDIEIVKNSC